MSGSLPRIRPPGSAALKLWPNAGALMPQSPDRSGTFERGNEAGGPMGRKFFSAWTSIGGTGGAAACARTIVGRQRNAASATAGIRRDRMPRTRTSQFAKALSQLDVGSLWIGQVRGPHAVLFAIRD